MNVPYYRIGSDIPISFFVDILDHEEPVTTLPEDTIITLMDPYGQQIDIDWTINQLNVSGRFPGSIQKTVGVYTVKIVVNKGKQGMVTADRKLFCLVAHSWEAGPIAEGVIVDISDMENPSSQEVIDVVKWLTLQEHEQNQRIDSAQKAAEAAADGIAAAIAAAIAARHAGDATVEDVEQLTLK